MAVNNQILFTLVLGIVCISSTNAKAFEIQKRIVDGNFVKSDQFPFMVSLFDNRYESNICGGTILTERYILSAAICFSQGLSYYMSHPQHISASIGTTNFMGKDGVTKNISSIVRHPMYGIPKYHNDLALLKTLDKIVFTEFIKPVVLPTEPFDGIGMDVSMCGFGGDVAPNCIQDCASFSHTMKMHKSVTVSLKSCKTTAFTPTDSFVCTKNPKGRSICMHDEGNPLIYNNTLIAVASDSFQCIEGYPDIYTKVFEELAWLKAEMKN